MSIINGTFDDGLSGWNVIATGAAKVIWTPYLTKYATLLFRDCDSYAELSQTFVVDAHILSFDMGAFAWGSASIREWILEIDGVPVLKERVEGGQAGAWYYWNKVIDMSDYLGKTAKLRFLIRPNYDICAYEIQYTVFTVDNVKLTPKTGSVSFESSPQGAKIFIDNTDTGQVAPAVITIPIGIHTYTLRLLNYYDYSGTVEVLENQINYVSAVLILLTGNLNISSIPARAQIFIDEIDTGFITPILITDITVGIHTYRLRMGFQDSVGTFEIFYGQITYINILLSTARLPEGVIPRIPSIPIPTIPPRPTPPRGKP